LANAAGKKRSPEEVNATPEVKTDYNEVEQLFREWTKVYDSTWTTMDNEQEPSLNKE